MHFFHSLPKSKFVSVVVVVVFVDDEHNDDDVSYAYIVFLTNLSNEQRS